MLARIDDLRRILRAGVNVVSSSPHEGLTVLQRCISLDRTGLTTLSELLAVA